MKRKNFPERRKVRQQEAEDRHLLYRRLTAEQKQNRALVAPGNAARERKRLGLPSKGGT